MFDEAEWRVGETADYICERRYAAVALQLPDELLQHAADLSSALNTACTARGHAAQVYILADTTYNSLSVDEVAAAHIGADCIVHFGRASLTKLSRLPAFFVFPEQQLNVPAAAACLAGSSLLASGSEADGSKVLVFVDQPLLHQLQAFESALRQQVEQRHGAAAAQRLVFPSVPRQHMEPERPAGQAQQAQQAQQPQAGCCGGGSCAAPQPAAQSAACGQACPCSSTAAKAPAQPPATGGAVDGAAVNSALPSSSTAEDGSTLHSLAGYEWQLPAGGAVQDCGLAWLGAPDAPALLQLQLTYSACPWAMLDPVLLPPAPVDSSGSAADGVAAEGSAAAAAAEAAAECGALTEGLPLEISRALRRRYFLVEKARDANIVGILVGTLGAAGYADAVQRLRRAAAAAGKKTYTLLVGKPSPAKLANFPEIEVFVLVADPQGQILDSKEFLAPIITPHEALLAFDAVEGVSQWNAAKFRLGFEDVLEAEGLGEDAPPPGSRRQEPRFSFVSGGYTGGNITSLSDSEEEGADIADGGAAAADQSMALALHAQQALQITAAPGGRSDLVEARSAADYLLHKRSWQGVETPLTGAAPAPVVAAAEGRAGRAAGYVEEGPGQRVTASDEQPQGQQ
ncbi:diphthamide biosynthesis 2 [Chlorella sorokiniana]|uniref:Diphthamide biosynthesis 2 n=1 Tax=Chlorella sorokiniana TaxID=3076 RepID=A0A2P6TC15_CHLSO|nr:diphthamide biosynthesis 2 [Chlorella sorokiniana]|eukprot:PRW20179.1 diphthamide biosynthesis 2 [Chlorella sorokiniana]